MMGLRRVLGMLLAGWLATASVAWADGKPEDYLTKDGKFKETLEISDLQGGFAGFTGMRWTVDPSGAWTVARVGPQNKTEIISKGTLSKEQMKSLAERLAKHDLLGLKNVGKVDVNPHVVTIKFGKQEATLSLPGGEPLPKPNPDKPTVESRFSAISLAVQELAKEKKEEKRPQDR